MLFIINSTIILYCCYDVQKSKQVNYKLQIHPRTILVLQTH